MQVSPCNMMQRYLLGSVTATVASVGVVLNFSHGAELQQQRSEIPARPKTSARTTTTTSAKRAERGEGEEEEGGGRRGDNGPGTGPARVSSAGFDQWSLFFSPNLK
jgi:hypothetical protein